MKVWLFMFTRVECQLQSARVSAADRAAAVSVMREMMVSIGEAGWEEGVILTYIGEMPPGTASAVVSCIKRNGETLINESMQ
jgi:hypothetical protein